MSETMLDRNSILEAKDDETADVEVPQWGGTVRVRGLSASERDKFESRFVGQKPDLANIRAELVVMCSIGEDGKRIFQDKVAQALGQKNAKAVNLLSERIQALSGLTEADLQELEGNSETAPSGGSYGD